MMDENLTNLKKRLYKKGEKFEERINDDLLLPGNKSTRTYWENGMKKKGGSFWSNKPKRKHKKIVIFGLIGFSFFAILVAGAVFYFVNYGFNFNGNIISSKKIDIKIEGPSIINAGENSKWRVFITNNNETNLELSDLIIDYPEGALALEEKQVSRERRSMGDILPGETRSEEIHIAILGNENEQKEINITLEYRLAGTNAIFGKSAKHTIEIGRSPIGISLSLPPEIESGQPMTINAECISNSELILEDVYFKMEYPPGFRFIEASVDPAKNNDTWRIGDLMPEEKRNFEIKGILEGVDLTEIGFNAFVGKYDEREEFKSFGLASSVVLLKRPFINFSFLIDGKDKGVVSSESDRVSVSVLWKNNLPTEIRNAGISLRLTSAAVDLKTLSISGGFYRSYDDSIIWNSSSAPEFVSISPGQGGNVSFSFKLKNPLPVQSIDDKNFTFVLEGEMSGIRTGESGQDFIVKGNVEKEVKITSRVQLNSVLSRSAGYFLETGPIPPRVGAETTYTIVWSVSNFYNDISDVFVRSSLPPYVKWLGVVRPNGENIVYTPSTGALEWKAGNVESTTGILRPVKEIAFQISFLPAPNHEGDSPVLVSKTFLEGKDVFTGAIVSDSRVELKTDSTSEAQADGKFGRVVGQ